MKHIIMNLKIIVVSLLCLLAVTGYKYFNATDKLTAANTTILELNSEVKYLHFTDSLKDLEIQNYKMYRDYSDTTLKPIYLDYLMGKLQYTE